MQHPLFISYDDLLLSDHQKSLVRLTWQTADNTQPSQLEIVPHSPGRYKLQFSPVIPKQYGQRKPQKKPYTKTWGVMQQPANLGEFFACTRRAMGERRDFRSFRRRFEGRLLQWEAEWYNNDALYRAFYVQGKPNYDVYLRLQSDDAFLIPDYPMKGMSIPCHLPHRNRWTLKSFNAAAAQTLSGQPHFPS